MEQALADLVKKYAIISPRLFFSPDIECCKRFVPSNIRKGKKWISQSVHIIYKDGTVQRNVCKPSICEWVDNEVIEWKRGQRLDTILASKSDVDKVVFLIKDGIERYREMIVYQFP